MFDREHPAGPAEAGHDFVGNQQRLRAITPFADSLQRAWRPKSHPGGPLNKGLDHHSGDLCRLGWRQILERLYVGHLNCRKIPVGMSNLEHGRRAQAGGACRIAMITAPESDELMLS